ncbi:MAG: SDR family oxidoreductase [Methanomassiliicoccales archaeon]|nr:SDR family oxidoreductase [Methanomassiliicoccales archaeon]
MSSTKNIVLVTGANSGMGKATTAILADKGYHVVMLCRDEARGKAAHGEIIKKDGRSVDLMYCDLGNMRSICNFVLSFKERYDRLDVLINNAGVITTDRRETSDGLELQFGVNHIGHFLLTISLLDLLERSDAGRIVVYSSGAHKSGRIHFDDYNLTHRYGVVRSYGQSKLANLLFTRELSRRLREGGSKITINACHPGAVATQMGVDRSTGFGKTLVKMLSPFFQTPEQGCRTAVYLATSPEVASISGEYFYKCKVARTSKRGRDMDAARRLYELSENIIRERTGP